MKKDKYLRARGGKAKILNLSCTACGSFILQYQKDGPGQLLRCYLNRIVAPESLEKLQHDPTITEVKDIPNLKCSTCQSLIGTPMRHTDRRLAFRLHRGAYHSQRSKGDQS